MISYIFGSIFEGIIDGIDRYYYPPPPLTDEYFENYIIFMFSMLTMDCLNILQNNK